MKIIVCIKQVPASSEVQIDPVTGVLMRDGSNTKMNPYDLYALETALKIKEQKNAQITSITMAPAHIRRSPCPCPGRRRSDSNRP